MKLKRGFLLLLACLAIVAPSRLFPAHADPRPNDWMLTNVQHPNDPPLGRAHDVVVRNCCVHNITYNADGTFSAVWGEWQGITRGDWDWNREGKFCFRYDFIGPPNVVCKTDGLIGNEKFTGATVKK